MSTTSVTIDTFIQIFTAVKVDTVTNFWCFRGYQFKFILDLILIKYEYLNGSYT